jgi:hypothetical protein
VAKRGKPKVKSKPTKKRKTAARKKPAPRKRDFKAEYSRRIAAALAKGKTKQAGRGHKVAEHVERREKEAAKFGGITKYQDKIIRRWHLEVFNPKDYREVPTMDDLIEWSKENGYPRFKQYRQVWDSARKTYMKELNGGTWESRGMGYLYQLTEQASAESYQWLYYH